MHSGDIGSCTAKADDLDRQSDEIEATWAEQKRELEVGSMRRNNM